MATVYQRSGTKKLWLRYWDGTKEVRRSSGTEIWAEAEAELARCLERVRNPCPLWEEVVTIYFEKVNLKPKTLSNYRSSLRNVSPLLRGKRLDEITIETLKQVVAYRQGHFADLQDQIQRHNKERLRELAETGKTTKRMKRMVKGDVAIRRDLAFIGSVFQFSQTLPGVAVPNPYRGFNKSSLKEAEWRTRFLSWEEWQILLDCCTEEQQKRILTLAVETGMRRNELERLRWDQVDLERREIILDAEVTKNRRSRVIPLSEVAFCTLSAQPRNSKVDEVFWHHTGEEPSGYYDFTNWWDGVRGRAEKRGVTDLTFHDLRRTFASWWLQRGGDWEILRNILGHSQQEMTDRYSRWRTEDLHIGIRSLRPLEHINDRSRTYTRFSSSN